MPETVSPGEVAHTLAHHHKQDDHGSRRAETIEILEAVLLAFVAIATAWSGYQAARFDGRQAHLYGVSNRDRAAQNRASTRAGQLRIYDTTQFGFWLQSTVHGDKSAAAIFARRFTPGFKRAFHAWLALDPFHNPKAPPGPSFMPQYRNVSAERAAVFDEQASAAFDRGTHAREESEKYIRNTVLLATVLFLTALAQRFRFESVRFGLLVVSAVLLAIGLYFVVTYPRA